MDSSKATVAMLGFLCICTFVRASGEGWGEGAASMGSMQLSDTVDQQMWLMKNVRELMQERDARRAKESSLEKLVYNQEEKIQSLIGHVNSLTFSGQQQHEQIRLLRDQLETLKTETSNRRNLQSTGPAAQGELVHIIKRTVLPDRRVNAQSFGNEHTGGRRRSMQDIQCDVSQIAPSHPDHSRRVL
jgi:septal ring factor EnvC (AmiA/AmiB activator)